MFEIVENFAYVCGYGPRGLRDNPGMNNAEFKKLICTECRFEMSDELFERFIGCMEEVNLKNKEVLIPYGKLDTNVYIHKSGILRACYFDGENEKTYGFATPGTVTISWHSYFMRRPASFQIEACCETEVLKMPQRKLDELVKSSHEFAQWLLAIQQAQLYSNEFKHVAISGQAKERFLSLIKNRPEIMAKVPSQVIASYLGITPTYLCRLKKSFKEKTKIS